MKIYEIKNSEYETKKAIGENMEDALHRYYNYLKLHINVDYSYEEIYRNVTSCTYIGDYNEEEFVK